VKLLHAADLHLDSPLRGLARYDGAPVDTIRGATRRAFENLVEMALTERVDAVLLAGDVYDGDWRDYSTGLWFAAQVAKLGEASIRVFLIRGNHDAQSQITRSLRLPQNVVELATRAPRTVVVDDLGLAVHGQGFPKREVTADLAARYPDPVPGLFNVGLLHTCLDGREGHDPYAPTSVDVLAGKGYDYWALGHVHAREVVSRSPWIVFPGNLQGRNARETGPKGATLVTVTDGAIEAVHCPLDVVRWYSLTVDAEACRSGDDVVDAVRDALGRAVDDADGRLVAARIRVVGATPAHGTLHDDPERHDAACRAVGFELGTEAVFVERIVFDTRARIDLPALRERDDPIGQLARSLAALRRDPTELSALRAELAALERKLPREARDGPDGIRLDDDGLCTILDDVEQMLLPRLLRAEEP
jgi:DNA repair exonuclease SbcCD nuclease subunit